METRRVSPPFHWSVTVMLLLLSNPDKHPAVGFLGTGVLLGLGGWTDHLSGYRRFHLSGSGLVCVWSGLGR